MPYVHRNSCRSMAVGGCLESSERIATAIATAIKALATPDEQAEAAAPRVIRFCDSLLWTLSPPLRLLIK